MSIYRYSGQSLISNVQFRHANDRPPVAVVTAARHASEEQIAVMRTRLEAQGFNCVPVICEGTVGLQVAGFSEANELAAHLQAYDFTQGVPQITAEPGDHATRSIKEWMQASGLKGAGWLNLVGDVALLASGIANHSGKDITAGALYTGGAAVLARYGNVNTERQVRHVLEKTSKFLKEQAVLLPDECGLARIMKESKNGVVPHVENFLYRYPSEVMLGAYTLGAFTMLKAGWAQKDHFKTAYGVNSVALKAASLLIPEKSAQSDTPPTTQAGKLMHWIQEKPLRLFGFGSMISDVLLGLSAYRDSKVNPASRGYIFKFITTGCYIAADALMAVSHKDQTNGAGKFDADEQRYIVALVAEALVRQPKAMQLPLAHQLAGFLATQGEIRGNADSIGNMILEQMAQMQKNPWTCRMQPVQGVSAALSIPGGR